MKILIAIIAIAGGLAFYLLSGDSEIHTVHTEPSGDPGNQPLEEEDSYRFIPYRELIASSHHPLFNGGKRVLEHSSRPKHLQPETDNSIKEVIKKLDEDEKHLEELLRRNRNQLIITLADDAISSGNRDSFDRLQKLTSQLKDPKLKEAVRHQVYRVDTYYIDSRQTRTSALPVEELFPEAESEDTLTVGQLLTILIAPDQFEARYRCRSAFLLGKLTPKKYPKVPGYLLHAAKTDPDLSVVDESLHSFAKLTGVNSSRVFDWSPAAVWWALNNPERP